MASGSRSLCPVAMTLGGQDALSQVGISADLRSGPGAYRAEGAASGFPTGHLMGGSAGTLGPVAGKSLTG